MTQKDIIRHDELKTKYNRTGVMRNAIFGSRKALMDEIWATGCPIYVDESYYAHYSEHGRLQKNGEHYSYGPYAKMEEWRDCHYYIEYVDSKGNKIWILEGGRF